MKQQPEQGSSRPVETRPYAAQVSSPRMRVSAITTLLGLFVFAVGAKPDWFGWDRSPVVGFVQLAVFRSRIICLGYMGRRKGTANDRSRLRFGFRAPLSYLLRMADIAGWFAAASVPHWPY
jgi:hypothetical protein